MKCRAQIIKSLKQMFKQEYYIVLSFIIFPLIVGFIFGVMSEESFEGKTVFDPVRVNVIYNEEHKVGKILTADFERESIQSFIVRDEENPECQVTMGDDFKTAQIINLNTTNARADIVKSFFENIVGNICAHEEIEAIVMDEKMEVGQKQEIMNMIEGSLGELSEKEGVITKIVDKYKTLNAYEYYALSIFSFTSMLLVTWFINKYVDEAEDGIIRRSLAADYSKTAYVIGAFLSSSLMAMLINCGYIFVVKLMGNGFREHLSGVLMIAVVQSMMQAALALVIVTFVKHKMAANGVVSILLLIPAILGGTFTNVDTVEGTLGKLMGKFAPNSLILNSYKSLAISGSLECCSMEIVSMLGLCILFMGIAIGANALKQEV